MRSAVRARAASMLVVAVLATVTAGCSDGAEPRQATAPSTSAGSGTAAPGVDATSTAEARQPHKLVLTATGNARIDSFSYMLDGEVVQGKAARLPWRQSVDVPADGKRHEWRLTVQYRDGDVHLVAYFNGQQQTASRGRSSGRGTGAISGSVLG